jgi:lipoprotein-releasing system permease protein
MPFEWFIALRYLREGRSQTALILSGVAVGVGVIVFLSALINGLQTSLIERTLGSQAHLVVRPQREAARPLRPAAGLALTTRLQQTPQRLRSIAQWQQVRAAIDQVSGVAATTPTVAGSAFANRGTASKSIALRGVEPESFTRIIDLRRSMVSGRFSVGSGEVVVGKELADDLGVLVGDKLRVVTAEGRGEVFTVTGIFDLGNKDLNERWVLVALRAAQNLLDLTGGASTIEAKVRDIFAADELAAAVSRRTGLVTDSWTRINAQLMVGLKSQNSSKYMIQFFVVVAVALGIASVLVVAVVQKSREIGILKAVGTSTKRVIRIFLIQGALLGLVGSALGCGLGAALSLFFATLAKNPDGSPTFPVELTVGLYLSAAFLATLTGLIAAAFPARRAARLDPAQVIRYG